MRKTVLLLASTALVVLLASGVALAATYHVGDDGPDRILGTDVTDTLIGRGGNDVITGKGGPDVVLGGGGDDGLSGGYGDDEVRGGDGDDTMGGDVAPVGIPGSGTSGNDTLYGGDGNDLIVTRLDSDNPENKPRRDTIFCGDGRDTVRADPIDTVASDCERVRGTERSVFAADVVTDSP